MAFVVTVTANVPEPWSKTYTHEKGTESAVVSRSLRQYRKDLKAELGSKRIKELTIVAKRAGKEGEAAAQPEAPVAQ